MKVVFQGDTHGSIIRVRMAMLHAMRVGAEAVLQAGDFGYWPYAYGGNDFLVEVSRCAQTTGVEYHWVDGNHEDHASLPHGTDEPYETHPGVFWHPRGTRQKFGDSTVLFIGGAQSVDQNLRTEGRDWFRNEIPNQRELHRAADEPADVVLAHEGPSSVELVGNYKGRIPPSVLRRADGFRKELETIRRIVEPRLWVHGHWHLRNTAQVDMTRVETLSDHRSIWTDHLLEEEL